MRKPISFVARSDQFMIASAKSGPLYTVGQNGKATVIELPISADAGLLGAAEVVGRETASVACAKIPSTDATGDAAVRNKGGGG